MTEPEVPDVPVLTDDELAEAPVRPSSQHGSSDDPDYNQGVDPE